jgi:hypothetical protein
MMCNSRVLAGYFQFRCQYYSSIAPYQCSYNCALISKGQSEPGNIPIKQYFSGYRGACTEKYSQINLNFRGLMRAVGNLYFGSCIVLPSDGKKMNSALPSPYLKVLCCRDDITVVRKLFVASDWSRIKRPKQLKLPELHLVA